MVSRKNGGGGRFFYTGIKMAEGITKKRTIAGVDTEEVGADLYIYQHSTGICLGAELARERRATRHLCVVKLDFPNAVRRKGGTRFGPSAGRLGVRACHLQGPVWTAWRGSSGLDCRDAVRLEGWAKSCPSSQFGFYFLSCLGEGTDVLHHYRIE